MSEHYPSDQIKRERTLGHIMTEILSECRLNHDLYNTPSKSIELTVGGVDWSVSYLEEWEVSEEAIIVSRNNQQPSNEMEYTIYAINRDLAIEKNGVHEQQPIEPAELAMVHAIITTAHNIRRSAAQ